MVNFLVILIISQLATHTTHTLVFKKNIGSVRASSFLTLSFILLTLPFSMEIIPALHALFLGSTFVGLTEPRRLSRYQLFVASFIFCLIFQFLILYLKGFGGSLGVSAFLACLVTFWLNKGLSIVRG
jgi:hypothetical protein